MKSKIIIYLGRYIRVKCDGKCNKAWGHSEHPRIGNWELPDFLLGKAPVKPGTSEGFEHKPLSNEEFPNKWCVRQCERCRKEL